MHCSASCSCISNVNKQIESICLGYIGCVFVGVLCMAVFINFGWYVMLYWRAFWSMKNVGDGIELQHEFMVHDRIDSQQKLRYNWIFDLGHFCHIINLQSTHILYTDTPHQIHMSYVEQNITSHNMIPQWKEFEFHWIGNTICVGSFWSFNGIMCTMYIILL